MDIMAEEVKETREDFEAQLEESLNKASTNEDMASFLCQSCDRKCQ